MNKHLIIMAVFLSAITIFGNGCTTPQVTDCVTTPSSYMIKKSPLDASVAILSWKDNREFIRDSNTALAFIPLVPFGRSAVQSRLEMDAKELYTLKPQDKYQAQRLMRYPGYAWGNGEEYTIPKVIEDYLKKTSTFKNVYFSMSADTENYKKAAFLIQGTLSRWYNYKTTTLYCMGGPGVVIVSLFYIPWQFSRYEIDFQLEFIDNKSHKVLYSQRYSAEIAGTWKTFPCFFGLIGYKKGNFTSHDLQPFVEHSLENFVSNIQNIVVASDDDK